MSGPIVLALRVLVAAALYTFLGTALWIMWQEIKRTTDTIISHKVPPIRLEVRLGAGPAALHAFSQPDITLGRDPQADVPLADETVSARHALLSFHHRQWWLEDLGSSNGTRLNQEAVTVPTVLMSGDEITCGKARVVIKLPGEALGSLPGTTGG